MTKSRKRTQTGGGFWDYFTWSKKETMPADAPPDAPAAAPEGIVGQITDAVEGVTNQIKQQTGYSSQDGGSRRRRRCTKKHRHSSACKRKSKGRKSYKKRR